MMSADVILPTRRDAAPGPHGRAMARHFSIADDYRYIVMIAAGGIVLVAKDPAVNRDADVVSAGWRIHDVHLASAGAVAPHLRAGGVEVQVVFERLPSAPHRPCSQ